MHAVTDRGKLHKELGLVQTVVERRHTIPILSHVRVEAREGRLELIGTDLDVGMRVVCEAVVEKPGVVCVPARKFFDIVRALPDEPLTLESREDRLLLVCGRSRFRLATLPAENFPDIPTWPERVEMTIPAHVLRRMIARVAFATTHEEARYALSGIQMEWVGGDASGCAGLRLVATDGHRLALTEYGTREGERRECLIPQKTMRELVRLIAQALSDVAHRDSAEEEDASAGTSSEYPTRSGDRVGTSLEVQFYRDPNHVSFRVGGRELVSRVLTGQFPNYELVIPKEWTRMVVVSVGDLRDALRRVAILADERSRGVRVTFSSGRIEIAARRIEDDEEAIEEVPCHFEGEPLEIAFNSEYLLDFLDALREDEADVRIRLKDAQSPALLDPVIGEEEPHGDAPSVRRLARSAEDTRQEYPERYLYVVMPMRLG